MMPCQLIIKKSCNVCLGLLLLLTAVAGQGGPSLMNACTYASTTQRCVSVPLLDAERDAQAKRFQTHPGGKASIYIVRPSVAVRRQVATVLLNGRPIAELAPFTYVETHVAAGHYRIGTAADHPAEIELDVEPGRLYFVQTELSRLFFTVSSRLERIDDAKGSAMVSAAMHVMPIAGVD